MKIALIGYGKMGKTIESLKDKMGFDVVEIYDENSPFLNAESTQADVAIDFTMPKLAPEHIIHAVKLNLPIVVGTTGWYDQFQIIKDFVISNSGTLFYATNFSIGVNLFFAINRKMAEFINNHPSYNIELTEIHHTEKLDAPSGTAITLAEQTIQKIDRLNQMKLTDSLESTNLMNQNGILPIQALRIKHVPGTHEITYSNDIDSIKLSHIAHNRLGFAQGAVEAARFAANKKGIFTMSDLLNF